MTLKVHSNIRNNIRNSQGFIFRAQVAVTKLESKIVDFKVSNKSSPCHVAITILVSMQFDLDVYGFAIYKRDLVFFGLDDYRS